MDFVDVQVSGESSQTEYSFLLNFKVICRNLYIDKIHKIYFSQYKSNFVIKLLQMLPKL